MRKTACDKLRAENDHLRASCNFMRDGWAHALASCVVKFCGADRKYAESEAKKSVGKDYAAWLLRNPAPKEAPGE